MTDFGLEDDAVGLMRGVIHAIAPRSAIADLTHRVPAFDVAEGARLLADAPGIYPPGSVFCVVVDPGVGTARRAVVARLADGTCVVAPDNGVLTEVLARHGPATVRVVTNQALVRKALSATFHGRDVFAPVAAHLAAGTPFEQVGKVVTDLVRLERQEPTRTKTELRGVIEALDLPFGNVWTNVPTDWLEGLGVAKGDLVSVFLGDAKQPLRIPFCATFGDVPEGEPLLYMNSRGKLGIALNMANFAEAHGIERGAAVRLVVRGR
jgi:S-adenosylmethionine hydrolase